MPRTAYRLCLRLSPLLALLLVISGCSLTGGGGEQATQASGDGTSVTQPNVSGAPESNTPLASPMVIGQPDTSSATSRIVEGGLEEPRTLNPLLVADPISEQLSHLIFNGLVFVEPESGEPRGDLAATWDVSQDRKIYTFHLRDGVSWHDGQRFTARDVVFTYNLMMNKQARSPRYSRLVERVRSVQMSGEATVVITLISPDASFLTSLATFGIVPEHVLSNTPPEELIAEPFGTSSTVGTGPFMLQRWVRGDQIVFTRNPRYFRGQAAYEQYIFRVVPSAEDVVAGLAEGSIDWAPLDPAALDKARADDRVRVLSVPGYDLSFVALQLDPAKSKLFLDRRLRQALMLALDRGKLIEDVWHAAARPADGTLPPASWAFAPSATRYTQNLNEARRLLQEAGWVTGDDGIRSKDGSRLQLKVLTNGDNLARQQTVYWLIASWQAIGVEAVPEFDTWSTVRQRATDSRDFQALVIGFRTDVDPDQTALWSSDSFFDAFNVGHYSNAEVDKLLGQALASGDTQERKEIYRQVQDLVMNDLPILPLVFPDITIGFSPRLQDVELTAILVRNRAHIEQWVPTTGG